MEPSDPLESQWVSIHIRDRLEDRDINIRDSLISTGDFHSPSNPLTTLTEESIDKMTIPSNGLGEVCATGRRGSEGWLDLFDGEKKICELHWDNRSERYINDFEVLEGDDKYRVECSGWSSERGPLGHVFVDISEREKKVSKGKGEELKEELEGRDEVVRKEKGVLGVKGDGGVDGV